MKQKIKDKERKPPAPASEAGDDLTLKTANARAALGAYEAATVQNPYIWEHKGKRYEFISEDGDPMTVDDMRSHGNSLETYAQAMSDRRKQKICFCLQPGCDIGHFICIVA